jgi:hypothetical protein
MGLKPERHERLINTDYSHPHSSERGGALTINSVSGIEYADYSANPNGLAVLGIKLNDHWYIEEDRMPPPDRIRRVETWYGIARALYAGEVTTDWVHPDYADSITVGDVAYVGPSGLLVNDQVYGGGRIGQFTSNVGPHDSYVVQYNGLGLKYTWMNPQTKEVESINATNTMLSVGGWVKLRIDTTQSP